jgi:hypothetical protein
METAGWDLRWKVALGLAVEVDHRGWHPTSLTKLRARCYSAAKSGWCLENTLRPAEELGMLDAPAEQIVDSTPMLGAAATEDTVRLVRHGVRKLIEEEWANKAGSCCASSGQNLGIDGDGVPRLLHGRGGSSRPSIRRCIRAQERLAAVRRRESLHRDRDLSRRAHDSDPHAARRTAGRELASAPGSNGSSACSRTATAPAIAAKSKHDGEPHAPAPWPISTRSGQRLAADTASRLSTALHGQTTSSAVF